jgi:hypothetical protein
LLSLPIKFFAGFTFPFMNGINPSKELASMISLNGCQ